MRSIHVIALLVVLALIPLGTAVVPAIMKVIDMLNNLVTTLTNEGIEDQQKFDHFSKWVAKEQEETKVQISTLETKASRISRSLIISASGWQRSKKKQKCRFP